MSQQRHFGPNRGVSTYHTFEEMRLNSNLFQSIREHGFNHPTDIQKGAIMSITSGKDVIVQAASGTGKTSALAISILQRINTDMPQTQALVLSPTHGLAMQMREMIAGLGHYKNVQVQLCVEGINMGNNSHMSEQVPHVISGTPGQVYNMLRQGTLRAEVIEMLVLDGADYIFDHGFIDRFQDLYNYLPSPLQLVFMSNYLTDDILGIAETTMKNPVRILEDPGEDDYSNA
ncbi:RNA helicase [Coemansia guatemalensis]|uniref:RNA helicase n=1 Tax=Coemansia guatemalensis TaxID=2761395 RepID=A0A9W8LX67_9FUNG|nr:RNA helicase [Coemansia guatemalensis]